MSQTIRNDRGVGLVQVLVGVALMSLIAFGMMTMISNSYKHQTNLGVLLEGRELAAELSELAKSPNCGIPQLDSPWPVDSSVWGGKEDLVLDQGIRGRFLDLKEGDKYSRFNIKKVAVRPYYERKSNTSSYVAMDGASPTDYANATIIKASLALDVESQDVAKAPIRTPIYLYLNNTRTEIIGCAASLEDTDLVAVCASMGGSWVESDNKCQLPCPPGLEQKEDGVCAVSVENGTDTYCKVNERCGVGSKYIINI